ncbi:MAG TPA: L-seryl-tRNA(Sec) selenium transferase, partial [bacterium]|nr:L-seryl-tRNA(Sec) selenium transferase [bacterium]
MGATPLRQLPSVERILHRLEALGTLAAYPRALVVACTRDAVEQARATLLRGGPEPAAVSVDALLADVQARLVDRVAPSLAPAINATGIVIHTNLGRAPLCDAARQAVVAAAGVTVLEVDPATGERSS